MLPARVLPWWLPRPYNKQRNRNHRAAKRPLLWRIGFLRAGAPAFLCVRERGHFMHVFACFNRVHAHHFASSLPIHKRCSLVFGRFMHKTKKIRLFCELGLQLTQVSNILTVTLQRTGVAGEPAIIACKELTKERSCAMFFNFTNASLRRQSRRNTLRRARVLSAVLIR